MLFRKTKKSDINAIMEIIKEAQNYLKENKVDQWQNNYPNEEIIQNDINMGYGYVFVKDEEVIGIVAVSFDEEKSYSNIYNGQWITNNKYAVIHRLAIKSKCRGTDIATNILKNIEAICIKESVRSIKIDTHRNNIIMQKFLKKNGFTYCGIIYLEDKSERLAFEKSL